MVNFEKLVENILLTESGLPSGDYPLKEYYMKHTDELKEVTSKLASKFLINTWPNEASPETFLSILAVATSRVNATPLVPFVKQFPLMDFVWFVADQVDQNNKQDVISGTNKIAKGSGDKQILDDGTSIGGIPKKFIDSLSVYPDGSNPLYGYTPVSTTGANYIGVLQRKYQNDLLGEFNLKTFDKFSLKRAFYGLLEMRKKTRSSVINTNKIPQDIQWIDKILQDPQGYSGKIQIPTQLKELYNDASATQVVTIAKTFHTFYESEVAAIPLSANPITTFDTFISNNGITDNTFKFVFPSGSPTESPNLSATNKKGGYIIENIKLMTPDPAKDVISALTNFGNYISQGEPRDWAGVVSGIGQIAQGLKGLGGPTMGR